MLRYRTQGLLALGLGVFAGGCFGNPEIRTDLRSEGPPDILVGMGQSFTNGDELPFFCRYVGGAKDEKAPGFVIDAILGHQTVCPDAAGDFAAVDIDPRGYGIRIMFDELLDPDAVETLDCDDEGICTGSLATTQPVEFNCGSPAMAVDYDGYYVPNGNNTTFPLGPSLVVVPASVDFATGTNCTITMTDAIHDHSGETVPADQADVDFKIADLTIIETDPADEPVLADRTVLDPDGAVAFVFNAYLNPATVTAADVEIVNTDSGAVIASAVAVDEAHVPDDAILVAGAADLPPGNYTARIKSGAVIEEVNGGSITLTANEDVRFVVE